MAERPAAPPPVPPVGSAGSDPSMDDILASIRKILSEDDGGQPPARSPVPPPDAAPDVFALDESMMVHEPAPPAPAERMPELFDPDPVPEPAMPPVIPSAMPGNTAPPPEAAASLPMPAPPPHAEGGLVTPEAAAAATSSVGSLLRALGANRQTAVSRGGPTIEDLVREELRPVLRAWLDEHLPGMVERLVRAEIERVVSRASDL